jgi:hypothetical protein
MTIEADRPRPRTSFSATDSRPTTAKSCFAPPTTSRATPPPSASSAGAAESLCRIIEHAPDLDLVPAELITHHINAIQAIVRERTKLDTATMASALSTQLRGVADEFLVKVNRDRPEHLEAILAPSIVPAE